MLNFVERSEFIIAYDNALNDNPLSLSAFNGKLWQLAESLRLHIAAAVWTSDGFNFCKIDRYDTDRIMRFLFPPSETEIARCIQNCFDNDLPQQDKLDSFYRVLTPKLCNLLLVDDSKLMENIKASRQAQQYEREKEALPVSFADINEQYSPEPTKATCENVAAIASGACQEGNFPSFKISAYSESEVYTGVMMAILAWISRLTVMRTEAWLRYEQELRECIEVLTDDFRIAVAVAQNPTNRPKAQNKLNVLQQENDLLNMSSYENEYIRMGMHTNDIGNTKMLTHGS